MPFSRREFLTATGWSLAASAASACTTLGRSAAAPVAAPRAYADWATVRAQFPLSPEYLHFSQFFIVSHPTPVREAIERHRRAIDANPFQTVEHGMFGADAENLPLRVQEAAATYLGGARDDVALVDSTTMGLALIYSGLPLRPGQEVLTTTHDHEVHHEAIRLAVEKTGARWRRAELYARPAAVTVEEVVGNLRRAIRRETRVVGLTWVHSSTGVKLPIRALAQVVAEANRRRTANKRILLVVDGVHGFGNQDETVAELGCDFFVAGTHKWIFAPRGTGVIWGKPEAWARVQPIIPSMYAMETYKAWKENRAPRGPVKAAWVSPGGFKAYEHQWAMAEAFQFHAAIGRARIADRIAALNDQCKEGLATMKHVTLHTPRSRDYSAGIICFDVAGLSASEVVRRLFAKKVIASASPYAVSLPRLAPSLVNDEAEVEAALRAVRDLV